MIHGFNLQPEPGGELSASDMARLFAEMHNISNITVAAPLNVSKSDGGVHIWMDPINIAAELPGNPDDYEEPDDLEEDQDDYPVTRYLTFFNPTVNVRITGFQPPGPHRTIWIKNIGTALLTFPHEDEGSAAASRFHNPTATDHTLPPQSIQGFQYHPGIQRWQPIVNAWQQFDQFTVDELEASTNDYPLGEYAHQYRLSMADSTEPHEITGFDNGYPGRVVVVINHGGEGCGPFVVPHQSTESAAECRVITGDGEDMLVPIDAAFMMVYDGASQRWRVVGRSHCDCEGGTGITSLNGLTGSTQTFSVGTSGSDFAIVSSGTNHAFNLPDASATARGAVTAGAQTIGGHKTFLNDGGQLTVIATSGGGGFDATGTQQSHDVVIDVSHWGGTTATLRGRSQERLAMDQHGTWIHTFAVDTIRVGVADGHPGLSDGEGSYGWTIRRPTGSSTIADTWAVGSRVFMTMSSEEYKPTDSTSWGMILPYGIMENRESGGPLFHVGQTGTHAGLEFMGGILVGGAFDGGNVDGGTW